MLFTILDKIDFEIGQDQAGTEMGPEQNNTNTIHIQTSGFSRHVTYNFYGHVTALNM